MVTSPKLQCCAVGALLAEQNKPKSVVQPYLEVVDIAGLVKGASTGAGLGNNFLSHIKVCLSILLATS